MQKGDTVVAKYECAIPNTYDFDTVLQYFHTHLFENADHVSFEQGSDLTSGPLRVAVRIYTKYYPIGKDWVGLHLTFATDGGETLVTGICASSDRFGGPLAVRREKDFLNSFIDLANMFEGMCPIQK